MEAVGAQLQKTISGKSLSISLYLCEVKRLYHSYSPLDETKRFFFGNFHFLKNYLIINLVKNFGKNNGLNKSAGGFCRDRIKNMWDG